MQQDGKSALELLPMVCLSNYHGTMERISKEKSIIIDGGRRMRAKQRKKELRFLIQESLDALNGLIIMYNSIALPKKNRNHNNDDGESNPLDK